MPIKAIVGDPYADLLSLADQTRCPSCAAALRPGAPWCSLCYADLRPAEPDPPAAAPPALTYGLVEFDPLAVRAAVLGWPETRQVASTAPAVSTLPLPAAPAAVAETRWPCTACETFTSLSETVCAGCGTGFLAGVRESEGPLLELPGVGDLTVLSRGQRLGLAAGVVLAVLVLTALVSLISS